VTFVENLKLLDSHERPILLRWALGQSDLALAEGVRELIGEAVGLTVPPDAFVAMDYTLDWLYAAISLTVTTDPPDALRAWPGASELMASPEDVDLLVAWEDDGGCHLVLLEAKGFTGWANR
jgi:hypothetical protein